MYKLYPQSLPFSVTLTRTCCSYNVAVKIWQYFITLLFFSTAYLQKTKFYFQSKIRKKIEIEAILMGECSTLLTG